MQVSGQNNQTPNVPQPQFNSSYGCGTSAPTAPAEQPPVQAQPQAQTGYVTCGGTYYPVAQTQAQPPATPPVTSGVNIQIFNPAVMTPGSHNNVNAPCYYPPEYYTGQYPQAQAQPQVAQNNPPTIQGGQQTQAPAQPQVPTQQTTEQTEKQEEKKKTEKRNIVVLTDNYIRNLESCLNSQDKAIRLNAAKAVFARLEEDDSRKDDKALNALINKMLQDPSDDVRFLALTALDGRMVSGDDYTVGLLKNMQNSSKGFGQEAIDASNILLKMSGQQVEKEFEVKNDKKKSVENPLYKWTK
jgi:hypothetical protein